MSIEYNKRLIPLARQLRRNMTPGERKLWHLCLKTYPIRFQRQKSIDRYIVDFYCHEARLAVEIDGTQHFSEDGKEYDAARTAVLHSLGIEVLRFSNRDINGDFAGVCEQIHNTVVQRTDRDPYL